MLLNWLYTYHFSRFDMFVRFFVNYFVRLRTNHYTLLTISPILFIFNSARNLSYCPLWRFVKIPIAWRERQNTRWEKWLARRFTKCHLYTSRFSHFANIFSCSLQFDDKCIAGFKKLSIFRENWKFYKGSFGEIMKKFLISSKKTSEHLWRNLAVILKKYSKILEKF